MAAISLQITPSKYYFGTAFENPHYHNGSAHHALREIYVCAKHELQASYAEPPQKKRRLNDETSVTSDGDYVMLAKGRVKLVSHASLL